jgi:Ca2+/Na+ antiporter
MLITVLYILGFLALLILGAWCVSEGGDILGDKYDATIVGGFIISWLNTAPETIFFITALETNNPNFAVGAISGSVIVVCTVAVGSCVYIGASSRKAGTIFLLPGVRKQAMMLGGSLFVMVLVLLFGFHLWIGALGILYYVGFMCWTIFHKAAYNAITSGGLNKTPLTPNNNNADLDISISPDKTERGGHNHDDDEDHEDEEEQPTWKGIAYLVAGGLIIYLCSEPFIQSVVQIGSDIGLTPLALAFFFAPIASEAPEILESISLSRKGKTQSINIAFSNLVGGTLSKTTLLLGVSL